mmetsp:Transcript_11544/g.16047  ORF Transcript_11544/g.16047 Transcript_11544/m.16047 type:complete len:822 (-) Transcript_11544:67-2532(-)
MEDNNNNEKQKKSKLPLQRDNCYRVLRHDEDPQKGLISRNPEFQGEPPVVSHVTGKTEGDPLISTTADLEVACKFAGAFQRIAKVNVTHFRQSHANPEWAVIDLTTGANRAHMLLSDSDHEKLVKEIQFAQRSQEVLLFLQVPPEFVSEVKIERTFEPITEIEDNNWLPTNLCDLEQIRSIGGFNDGLLLVKDKQTNKQFVMKRAKPNVLPERLLSWDELKKDILHECDVLRMYRKLGVPVPRCQPYVCNMKTQEINPPYDFPFLLMEDFSACFLPEGSKWPYTLTQEQQITAIEHLKRGFIVDCLFGNWNPFGGSDRKYVSVIAEPLTVWRVNAERTVGVVYQEDREKRGEAIVEWGSEVKELVLLLSSELTKWAYGTLSKQDIGNLIQQFPFELAQQVINDSSLESTKKKLLSERVMFIKEYRNWYTLEQDTKPAARDGHSATYFKKHKCIILFGGNSRDNQVLSDLWKFDVEQKIWTKLKPQGKEPHPRCSHSASVVRNNFLVIFGGFDQKKYFNDVHVYDVTKNEWVRFSFQKEELPAPRGRHSAATADSKIYIFGGYNKKDKKLNDFYELTVDVKAGSVKFIRIISDSDSPPLMHRHQSFVMQHKVWILPGFGKENVSNALHYYCLAEKKWHKSITKSQQYAPEIKVGYAAVPWQQSQILIIGGALPDTSDNNNNTNRAASNFGAIEVPFLIKNSVWCLDLGTSADKMEWLPVSDLVGVPPTPRTSHTATAVGEKVFLFGGRGLNDDAEFFDDMFVLRLGSPIASWFTKMNAGVKNLIKDINTESVGVDNQIKEKLKAKLQELLEELENQEKKAHS